MPTESDTDRRVAILQSYPQCTELSSSFLSTVVSSASQKFLDYTHRTTDPGSAIDEMVVELAVIKINMLGVEGTSSASEGGMSRVWDDIPPSLKRRMNAYRRVIGIDTDAS